MDIGYREEDEAWCGWYCYAFCHNYINLDESYKEASEYIDSKDKAVIYPLIKAH